MDTTASIDSPFARADPDPAERLLRFNDEVLAQGQALACAHEHIAGLDFGARAGPHLRHVIEHYEALVLRPHPHQADYDTRPRDRDLEQSPALARQRLARLRAELARTPAADLLEPLLVRTLGGVDGRWPMATPSTLGRELVFLASHAVHHFALLREHCARHGIELPLHFGVAPATVAHARRSH